jgi:hypothetical protein
MRHHPLVDPEPYGLHRRLYPIILADLAELT